MEIAFKGSEPKSFLINLWEVLESPWKVAKENEIPWGQQAELSRNP